VALHSSIVHIPFSQSYRLELGGELDEVGAQRLDRFLGALTDGDSPELIIDLRRVHAIEAVGVLVLANAARRVSRHGGTLTVERPRLSVGETLAHAGIT
jgi:anti-anti-sigma factor